MSDELKEKHIIICNNNKTTSCFCNIFTWQLI